MSRTVFALGVLGLSFTLAPIVMGPRVAQADPTCEASQVDGAGNCVDGGPPRPGPRLQGMRAFAADGFEQTVPGRIWDSARVEECFWKDIEEPDGVHTRCLPRFEWLKPGWGWFLDAACTIRVHWQDTCVSGQPDYVRDNTTANPWDVCSVQKLDALYPLGSPIAYGTLLYTYNGGACSPQSNAFDYTITVRPLGAAVLPSAFVEATIAPE